MPVISGRTTPHDEGEAVAGSEPELEALAQAIGALAGWKRTVALGEARMSPRALAHLARVGDEDLRARIADVPAAGEEALHAIMDHADEPARLAVAYRRKLPVAILVRCADDASPRVRARAAASAQATTVILAALARDAEPEVRDAAVRHAEVPLDAVIACTGDVAPEVRRAAFACLPSAGQGIAEALAAGAGDPDPLVRETVALHPATPNEARLRLAKDPVGRVARALARCGALGPGVLVGLACHADPLVRLLVVTHTCVPHGVIEALGSDASADVREAVAGHARTSMASLLRLASDPAPRVREVVAMRPSLSRELVRVLLQREEPVVSARLRERGDIDLSTIP